MMASVEFARARPDWHVVVRPHPNESVSDLRECLLGLDEDVGRDIEIDKESPLADACSKSSAVLGVNSTALVESLLAGCKVVLLRVPSAPPFFEPLLEQGRARAVRSGQELARYIQDLPQGTPRGYFSEPVEDVRSLVET
jgi:hypothetical protein